MLPDSWGVDTFLKQLDVGEQIQSKLGMCLCDLLNAIVL